MLTTTNAASGGRIGYGQYTRCSMMCKGSTHTWDAPLVVEADGGLGGGFVGTFTSGTKVTEDDERAGQEWWDAVPKRCPGSLADSADGSCRVCGRDPGLCPKGTKHEGKWRIHRPREYPDRPDAYAAGRASLRAEQRALRERRIADMQPRAEEFMAPQRSGWLTVSGAMAFAVSEVERVEGRTAPDPGSLSLHHARYMDGEWTDLSKGDEAAPDPELPEGDGNKDCIFHGMRGCPCDEDEDE